MFDSLFPKEWTTFKRLMWLKTNALARAVYETITGNPVSFTAKAAPLRQLKVAFSPVQDLHGYDAPWPAGGGKNKFDQDTVMPTIGFTQQSDGSWYAATAMSVSDRTLWTNSGEVSGAVSLTYTYKYNSSSSQGVRFIFKYTDGTSVDNYAGATEGYVTKVVTSNSSKTLSEIVTTYGTRTISTWIKDVQVEFGEPTSYSPYSNECPILGWDSLNVEQRGKNLWDDSIEPTPITAYSVSGTAGTYYGRILKFPSGTYTFSFNGTTTTYIYGNVLNADDSWASTFKLTQPMANDCTVTISNGQYLSLFVASGPPTELTSGKIMLNLGSTASAYTPYNPSSRSISITLGSTVYRGTVDVVTGVGEMTWGITDAADLPWSYDGVRWQSMMSGIEVFPTRSANILFEKYGASTSASAQTENMGFTVGGAVYIYTSDSVNSPTGKICYPLATPITIQLTPQEVESLAGDNTMWTDGDSLTVEYRSN